jgi:hypothetical protein
MQIQNLKAFIFGHLVFEVWICSGFGVWDLLFTTPTPTTFSKTTPSPGTSQTAPGTAVPTIG